MLTYYRRRPRSEAATGIDAEPDLRIGNLLDDPAVRRCVGLGPEPGSAEDRPHNIRRLLESAAA